MFKNSAMPLPVPLDPVWSIEPLTAERLASALNSLSPEAARVPAGMRPASPMTVESGGVAVVEVAGPLTRRPSIFQLIAGGTATEDVQRSVEQAAADEAVGSIVLLVDSPGGSTDGIAEAADAIFAARQRKPVIAQVQGMCCSAAYHLASQAGRIMAGRMDLIGSVGTRMLLFDLSKMFSKIGVRAVPIDTGEFKSAGAPGVEISDRHVEYFQGVVNDVQADFDAAIMRGRGMTAAAVKALGDGKVHVAGRALDLGLIDEIGTFNQTLGRLQSGESFYQRTRSDSEMATNQTNAATLAELKAGCPGMDDSFYLQQLEVGATLSAAQTAAIAAMQQRLQTSGAKRDRRVGQPETEENLSGAGAVTGDAIETFSEAIANRMKSGMSRRDALRAVAAENPELHQAFVAATNPNKRRVQDLIEERFS